MKSSGMPSIWINEFHINSIFTVSFRAPYTCKQQNKCKVSPYFQPTMHNQFVFSGLGTKRKKCPKRKVKETNVTSTGTSEISAVEIVDEPWIPTCSNKKVQDRNKRDGQQAGSRKTLIVESLIRTSSAINSNSELENHASPKLRMPPDCKDIIDRT
jgi:hypothetical protein